MGQNIPIPIHCCPLYLWWLNVDTWSPLFQDSSFPIEIWEPISGVGLPNYSWSVGNSQHRVCQGHWYFPCNSISFFFFLSFFPPRNCVSNAFMLALSPGTSQGMQWGRDTCAGHMWQIHFTFLPSYSFLIPSTLFQHLNFTKWRPSLSPSFSQPSKLLPPTNRTGILSPSSTN